MKVRNSGACKKRSRTSANGAKRRKANPMVYRSKGSRKKVRLVIRASLAYRLQLDHKSYFSKLAASGVTVHKESRAAVLALRGKRWKFAGEQMKHILKRLMTTIFDLRRGGIRHGISVRNTLTIYPALRDYTMLKQEFARVRQHKQSQFAKSWKSHLEVLAKTHWNCDKPLCQKARRQVLDNNGNKGKQIAAAFLIFGCGKIENWHGEIEVVEKGAKPSDYLHNFRPQPTIVISRNTDILQSLSICSVYCERVKVLSNVRFHIAFFACYYLYHIFDLAYTPADRKMFTLFDELSEASKDSGSVLGQLPRIKWGYPIFTVSCMIYIILLCNGK